MLNTEFTQDFGNCLTASELAEFLKLDRRTIVKYAYRWGGVEVTPGTWRFFEKRIKEVLNAEPNYETRRASLPSKCDSEKCNQTKNLSGQLTKVKEGSISLGRRDKKTIGKRIFKDKYGVFDCG